MQVRPKKKVLTQFWEKKLGKILKILKNTLKNLEKQKKNRKNIPENQEKYKWDLKKRSSLDFGEKIRKNTKNSEKYSKKL